MPRLKAISWVTFSFLALVTNTVGLAQTHSVDQLIEALGSDDAAAQVKAADDLAHLGAKAAPAVPALTQALTSSNAASARGCRKTQSHRQRLRDPAPCRESDPLHA